MLYAVPLNRVTPPEAGLFLLACHVASNPLGSVTRREGFMRRRARHLVLTSEGEWQPEPPRRARKRRRRKWPSHSPRPGKRTGGRATGS